MLHQRPGSVNILIRERSYHWLVKREREKLITLILKAFQVGPKKSALCLVTEFGRQNENKIGQLLVSKANYMSSDVFLISKVKSF